MTAGAALIHGDALHIPLADESVDLLVTSPPYWALRSYQDEGDHYDGQLGSEANANGFLSNLWAVTDECWRVLKPTGSLFVNLGDKYAGSGGHNNAGISDKSTLAGNGHTGGVSKTGDHQKIKATRRSSPDRYNQSTDVPAKSLMGLPWRYALGLICPTMYRTDRETDSPQWTLRAEIVWSKPNGLPESVTDRVRRSHEQWFHLTKQGRYYAAVDEVREAQTHGVMRSAGANRNVGGGTDQQSGAFSKDGGFNDYRKANGVSYNPLGKLPGSVWTIPSEPLAVPAHLGVDHFAAFPTEWPRRLILGWSPPGICIKCREGRVPVVDVDLGVKERETPRYTTQGANHGGQGSTLGSRGTSATITGYACACDVPIAPTRPAVVLDPFAGTGTVPMVARTLGRYGIGIDLSRDYLRLAAWRVFRSGHGHKAMARTDRERQGSLW